MKGKDSRLVSCRVEVDGWERELCQHDIVTIAARMPNNSTSG